MTFYFKGDEGALRTYFHEVIASLDFSFPKEWYRIALEYAAASGLIGIRKHMYALAETKGVALEAIAAVALTPLEILATEALHFVFHAASLPHCFDDAGIGKYQIGK
ncbi:hypothetical protein HYV82_00395 [Candidatus Woesearchaeota archaeon]|nr:hypothetical protein [Candidatus Woesearchaeota archaeon]